jgi:hypothetical protein
MTEIKIDKDKLVAVFNKDNLSKEAVNTIKEMLENIQAIACLDSAAITSKSATNNREICINLLNLGLVELYFKTAYPRVDDVHYFVKDKKIKDLIIYY